MEQFVEILEALMVISFGLSWPFNIIKSLKSKTARGKSLPFLMLIDFGYICGVLCKILGNNITWVFAFYVLNLVMVSWDMSLYFMYRARDKKRMLKAKAAEEEAEKAVENAEDNKAE